MISREARARPDPWHKQKDKIRPAWTVIWHAPEFAFQWIAYFLSKWAFLEVLEYLGILSVLFGVIFYYSEAGDRRKQKHYQAWQVVNTAQGMGGSGGRIEALQELNEDSVPLTGVNVASAFLQRIELRQANLLRANFEASDLRDCNLEKSNLEFANLRSANLRRGNLRLADLQQTNFEDADLVGATIEGADLSGANLKNADLRDVDFRNAKWQGIAEIDGANIFGVRNGPDRFVSWALQHGAHARNGDDQ